MTEFTATENTIFTIGRAQRTINVILDRSSKLITSNTIAKNLFNIRYNLFILLW